MGRGRRKIKKKKKKREDCKLLSRSWGGKRGGGKKGAAVLGRLWLRAFRGEKEGKGEKGRGGSSATGLIFFQEKRKS